jgi:ABC-type proline/glycine betaine transport system substrate-binding protein
MTRNTRNIKRILSLALAVTMLASVAALAGCAQSSGQPAAAAKPTVLKLADAGWDSIQVHNAIASFIINNGYDVKTETIMGSTPITWKALTENEIQIYMEFWSENVADYAEKVADGTVLELSLNFDDNEQGLYVPRYVIEGDPARGIEPMAPGLKTVKDLLNYPEVFPDAEQAGRGRIYGAISGWAADRILSNKYEAYGLDEKFNYFQPGSDAALAASLVAAYEKGEPWVGYYWAPTWVSGLYDLILLEDEPFTSMDDLNNGLTEFPANRVTVAIHPSVKEHFPEITAFLSEYKTSSALTAEALAVMNSEGLTSSEAAIWFMKNHPELLETWIQDKAVLDKVNAALAKEA